jgi:hypothetical protein
MSDSETPRGSISGWEAWVFAVLLLAIIGVLGWLGVQQLVRSRTSPARANCIVNLKQIDCAVQQWALENKRTAADTYSLTDTTLLAYMKGSVLPVCPDHGRYLPGTNVAAAPRCTIGGASHTL